jgi:hypothetical protein
MKRIVALLTGLGTLVPAPGASAASRSYLLRHPTHERCKAHYVRSLKAARVHGKLVRQVWCVYKSSLDPTSISVSVGTYGGADTGLPPFLAISADIWSSRHVGSGSELRGLPVLYTVKDMTTNQTIGSFRGLSNMYASCTVVKQLEGPTWIYRGESVGGFPACSVAEIRLPATHVAAVYGSFRGDAASAPSATAHGEAF